MTDPNSDLSLDQRILYRAASFGRASDRWWMLPLRWWLRDRQHEMCAWAREARRLVRALDEIADDAREQMQAVMPCAEPPRNWISVWRGGNGWPAKAPKH